jgi:hypothetical protein
MNNQDKEAFEKWFEYFYQVDFNPGDLRFMNQLIAWKYACEYKDRAYSYFVVEAKSHAQTRVDLEKLEAEIKKLREALEFYADEKNMVSLTGLPFGRRAREALKEVGEK